MAWPIWMVWLLAKRRSNVLPVWWLLWLVAMVACQAEGPSLHAEPWPQANALFRQDPQWVGGDGAYSCDLGRDKAGRGRVLWLFGDSSIAKTPDRELDGGWFIRNSLAIQTGYNPTSAMMGFYWGQQDGHPCSYFADSDGRFFWPGPCLRQGNKLFIAGGWLREAGTGQFGFASEAPVVFVVDNPDEPPPAWRPRPLAFPAQLTNELVGTSAVAHDGWWYLYGELGAGHDYVVSRIALTDLLAEDLSQIALWKAGQWQPLGNGPAQPTVLFQWGAPESSVHFDPKLKQFVLTQGEGFGATTLAVRTADRPEGPWSDPQTFLRPPESAVSGQNFVYAGKGHPELEGADLVVTYVPSQFDDIPVKPRPWGYSPHFVRVEVR
jgi:hypothetical protein